MTHSMTAFARREKQTEWGQATWELRGVNHRYLEIILSLPEPFSALEPLIRKKIQTYCRRGRVEGRLYYKPLTKQSVAIEIDEPLTNALINVYTKIADLTHTTAPIDANGLLHWPHLLKFPTLSNETLQPELIDLFINTLDDFCRVRVTEGKAIVNLLHQRINKLKALLTHVQIKLPEILASQRERLLLRLNEAKISLDPNRLEQEMLLFAHKTDVAEELDRLQIHLDEFNKLLKNQAQGKQLDFLLQELNREANTLAAKSLNADLTLSAVNIKILIEEMREQVQNIE